jgi:hypothetical protein
MGQPLWFVVRRPEVAFETGAAVQHRLRILGDLLYQGLDRLEWWDLDELHSSGGLPADLVPLYETLLERKDIGRFMGAEEPGDALRLLNASEEVRSRNEVVCAVGARYVPEHMRPAVEWLGYDPIYKSGTSYTLLTPVYLGRGGLFAGVAEKLNEFGLLRTESEAMDLGLRYRDLAEREDEPVEPLPLFDESFEVLAVGRVASGASLAA